MYRLGHASHPDVVSEGTGAVVEPGMGVGTLSETRQLNSFQALGLNTDEDRPTPFVVSSQSPAIAVTRSETGVRAVQSLCQLGEQPHLLFSHLEHSTSAHSEADGRHSDSDGTCGSCSYGHWNGVTLDCAGFVCPACGNGDSSRVTNQNSDEDIIASFNSLSVSNSGNSSLRLGPGGSHLSCRQQAATYGGPGRYFDDTTVDDLAGYLDEIMFLPKPMSEMAELMYT